MAKERYDLGLGFSYTKYGWHPDRKINPQYDGSPDVDWLGIVLTCPHGISGVVGFLIPDHPIHGIKNGWKVESWDPLTLSPSILCVCECHGYIREGKWVSA